MDSNEKTPQAIKFSELNKKPKSPVRRRLLESLGIFLGSGIIGGIVSEMSSSRKPEKQNSSRGLFTKIMDGLKNNTKEPEAKREPMIENSSITKGQRPDASIETEKIQPNDKVIFHLSPSKEESNKSELTN